MKQVKLVISLLLFFGAVGLVLNPLHPLRAQTTTSTIEGVIRDPNQEVLPGATVEVKGTLVTKTVASGEDGRYRVLGLPAGSYVVTVSLEKFQTKRLDGVVLFLDRTLTLDVDLRIGSVEEEITVRAEAPLIDREDPSLRQTVSSQTIDSIPLNGRNYLDLVQLTPGVVVNSNASGLTSLDSRGAILGERAGNASFLIDGHENNDDFRGGVFQDYSQDTIREFEVIETSYKAEFGRGSGGIINVISKSGTNDFGGSAYFFLRDDSLDSSNVEGEDPPKLERQDFGFTLGGPLVRDKSWYFASAERITEDREALFPQDIPPLLAAAEDFSRQPETTSTRAFAKWTHRINDNNDLRTHVSWSRFENINELAGAVSLPSASTNNDTQTWNVNAALTSFFGPAAFLESSLNLRDQSFVQNQDATTGGISFSLFLLDDGSFDFGPPPGSVQTLDQTYYGIRESLSFVRGNHSVKTGLRYVRTKADGVNGPSLQNVIVTVTPLFELFGTDSFQIPQGVAFLNPGDEVSRLRNDGFGLFVQDDWRVGDRLTLSLGLRWDYDTEFDDSDNLAPRLGLVWKPNPKTAVRASWGIFYDRYRLGLAQPVPEFGGFNGAVVVEANYPRLAADALIPFPGTLGLIGLVLGDPFLLHSRYGIPIDAVVRRENIQSLTGLTPDEFLADLNSFLGSLGIGFLPVTFSQFTGFLGQDLGGGLESVIRVDSDFETPQNTTFTLGLQRELGAGLLLGVTYVHREIDNILGLRIPNLAPESRDVGGPVTTDGGPLQRTYGPYYDGEYKALIATIEKRFRQRYQFQASYTWAEATDNLLNSNLGMGIAAQGAGSVPTDNLDLEFDRGNSDLAVEHSFVLSGVASLPYGFSVSGVLRLASGVKFSAAGEPIDYDGDGISSLRPPETERNQFIGPSFQNLDLRIEKRFRLGQRYETSALFEVFNVTNEDNPRLINDRWVNGGPAEDFGTTRVPLPGREIQLGFRFWF